MGGITQEGKQYFIMLSHFDVVNNIDLLRTVHNFDKYHEIKFVKKPKLLHVSIVDNARKIANKLNLKQKCI